jgi:hypothetical protein
LDGEWLQTFNDLTASNALIVDDELRRNINTAAGSFERRSDAFKTLLLALPGEDDVPDLVTLEYFQSRTQNLQAVSNNFEKNVADAKAAEVVQKGIAGSSTPEGQDPNQWPSYKAARELYFAAVAEAGNFKNKLVGINQPMADYNKDYDTVLEIATRGQMRELKVILDLLLDLTVTRARSYGDFYRKEKESTAATQAASQAATELEAAKSALSAAAGTLTSEQISGLLATAEAVNVANKEKEAADARETAALEAAAAARTAAVNAATAALNAKNTAETAAQNPAINDAKAAQDALTLAVKIATEAQEIASKVDATPEEKEAAIAATGEAKHAKSALESALAAAAERAKAAAEAEIIRIAKKDAEEKALALEERLQ